MISNDERPSFTLEVVYVPLDETDEEYNIRIYAKPDVEPVYAKWSLIAEGKQDSKENIIIYSQQDILISLYEDSMNMD